MLYDPEVLERRVRETVTDTYFSAVAVVHGVELGRPVGDVLAYYHAVLAPNPSYAALLHNTPSAPEIRVSTHAPTRATAAPRDGAWRATPRQAQAVILQSAESPPSNHLLC